MTLPASAYPGQVITIAKPNGERVQVGAPDLEAAVFLHTVKCMIWRVCFCVQCIRYGCHLTVCGAWVQVQVPAGAMPGATIQFQVRPAPGAWASYGAWASCRTAAQTKRRSVLFLSQHGFGIDSKEFCVLERRRHQRYIYLVIDPTQLPLSRGLGQHETATESVSLVRIVHYHRRSPRDAPRHWMQ